VYKVKLESANIDYEEMAKFNPNITAILLNIQPAIMKSVNFGDQSAFRMQLNLYSETKELFDNKDLEASFGNVLIKNLTVKIVEQIPIYIFSLEIGMMSDGRFLFKNIKQRISFEFAMMGTDGANKYPNPNNDPIIEQMNKLANFDRGLISPQEIFAEMEKVN